MNGILKYQSLIVDPELDRLVQPMRNKEKEAFINLLGKDPFLNVIHIWEGRHLCDREKFELCSELGVPIREKKFFFDNKYKAALYMCSFQLKKADLTMEYRKYLIGKVFHYESLLLQDDGKPDNHKYKLAENLGKRFNLSPGTVLKYNVYSTSMDTIFDEDESFARSILTGKVKVSHENVQELARLRPEEIVAIAKSVRDENPNHLTFSDIRNEIRWSHVKERAPVSKREREALKRYSAAASEQPAIKKMSVRDPDAEVISLCMTMGSWRDSIKRVCDHTNRTKISADAAARLMNELTMLGHSVSSFQAALVERSSDE